jgi:CubicO group peptidase (beta-lactamase class C family)
MLAACHVSAPRLPALVPPAGWTADGDLYHDPERLVSVTIVMTDAHDPREAVAAAWRAGDVTLPPPAVDEPPPTEGWDRELSFAYDLPSSRIEYRAYFKQFGQQRYVILVYGEPNALAKRDAQIALLLGALHPEGMHEETLAGPAHVPDAAALDLFATSSLRQLEVPGAAIAVMIDGKVVYERALGVKTLGDADPITPYTRFLLASVSKPITTFMEATLVDAGIFTWDTPVTELMPSFALGDDSTTHALKLWHMSCACTGMPRQDMEGLFEWSNVSPEERIAVMRTMHPTTKLGETFQYSNPMVAAGGYAAVHAFALDLPLAEAYATTMQAKVFSPIEMTSTTLDFATVESGDHASPHALSIDGVTHPLPLSIERAVEPIAPAGAIWSTLHDMERYALTELADGVAPDGVRVVSVRNITERRKLRIAEDPSSGYGLGIDVANYHGVRLLSHDGGSFGFGTTLYLFPDQHAGIVILTNIRNGNEKAQLPYIEAVRRRIVELMFDGARALADKELAYYVGLRRHDPMPKGEPLGEIVGHYAEPVLGALELRDTPSGPVVDVGEWQSRVARVGDKLLLLDPPFAGGAILIGKDTLIVPDQTTYTFHREDRN